MRSFQHAVSSRGVWRGAILATVTLLVTGAASAASTVIDQQQTTIGTSGAWAIGGESHQWVGQVITAGVSGRLEAVYFPVVCGSSEPVVVVEIRDFLDSAPLASATFAASSLPVYSGDPFLRRLPFPAPAFIAAGDTFALVLQEQTGGGRTCGVFHGPAGDPYPGGGGYTNSPDEIAGRVWQPTVPGLDLPFQTEVRTKKLKKVDQEQTEIADPSSVGGLAVGDESDQYVAQTVEAGSNGMLSSVRLPVFCNSGSPLLVEIQGVTPDGLPDGIVMTSETRPATALPPFPTGTAALRSIHFTTPVPVSRGDRFSIVLKSTNVSSPACAVSQGPVGDSYSGGDGFDQYYDSTSPGRTPWLPLGPPYGDRQDIPFQTIVD